MWFFFFGYGIVFIRVWYLFLFVLLNVFLCVYMFVNDDGSYGLSFVCGVLGFVCEGVVCFVGLFEKSFGSREVRRCFFFFVGCLRFYFYLK